MEGGGPACCSLLALFELQSSTGIGALAAGRESAPNSAHMMAALVTLAAFRSPGSARPAHNASADFNRGPRAGADAAVAIVARSFDAYWLQRASHTALAVRFQSIIMANQVDVSLSLRHHPLKMVPAIVLLRATRYRKAVGGVTERRHVVAMLGASPSG